MFRPRLPGLRVLEGKHIEPFVTSSATRRLRDEADARRLPATAFTHARVAYRDVASATNQRTLDRGGRSRAGRSRRTRSSAAGPRSTMPTARLCALLNSFVANWMVRRWVSHARDGRAGRAAARACCPRTDDERNGRSRDRSISESRLSARIRTESKLQALAARAWRLSREELLLVLEDFPLVEDGLKKGTLAAFDTFPHQRL